MSPSTPLTSRYRALMHNATRHQPALHYHPFFSLTRPQRRRQLPLPGLMTPTWRTKPYSLGVYIAACAISVHLDMLVSLECGLRCSFVLFCTLSRSVFGDLQNHVLNLINYKATKEHRGHWAAVGNRARVRAGLSQSCWGRGLILCCLSSGELGKK